MTKQPWSLDQYPACPACREEQWRWIETRPSRMFLGIHIASSEGDDTLRGVVDRQNARYARWLATVRYQVELISNICIRQHGSPK